jgi:L-ascorbate metabolism protein UlaG (beta-lactamase superfamily)
VGDLTFGDTPWLYRGSKKRLPPVDLAAVCARTAAILVSQGLPDHAHGPTLAALPCKGVPVVCSPAAEAAVRAGGFTDVTVLKHGDSVTVADGRVAVTATPGALVGPPWSTRENGFVVAVDGVRVYYEPHADAPADALASIGTVDVVITPAVSQRLGGYPLVMGAENAAATAAALGASVVIPLVNADFDASGPLAAVIREEGDAAGLAGRLRAAGSRARVVEATAPGVAARVEL